MNRRILLLLQTLEDIGVPVHSQNNIQIQLDNACNQGIAILTNRHKGFEIRWYSEENVLSLYTTHATQVSNVFMKHLLELNKIVIDYNTETEKLEENYFND